MKMIDYCATPNKAVAPQTGTVGTGAAVTLRSLLSGGALHAQTQFVAISVEDASCRLTFDGSTAPTATLGEFVTNGSRKVLSAAQAENCRVIGVSGTARLQIAQYSQ